MTQDRGRISALHRRDQASTLGAAMAANPVGEALRRSIRTRALRLIETLRRDGRPGLMEVFLEEYGLSSREGLALMCLAEALLRVPDLDTIDDLVADKVVPTSWREHLGHSSSALVNAATRGLLLSRHILDDDHGPALLRLLHGGVRKLGKPAIRSTLKRAMQELGGQFVLGETIGEAMQRGQAGERDGYTYSYDMLGEAALTGADADSYFEAYRDAIESVSRRATGDDPRSNPGISIKLSALHPRYEVSQRQRVLTELVPRVRHLAELARAANMGLHIDAEEADRLELSLDIIERVFCAPELASWGGFGAVVQAYDKRATAVIEWLYALARRQGRGMMIRLVKGAYWDAEIKRAQADGVADFPVFTAKAATDVSYICCARSLLDKTDRIYPQFATHNAHTMAAVLELATERDSFEFQRLHGMGRPLHELVKQQEGTRCRIYAPVGVHRDLVAYLVRRLLENSANSSFVNQIVDLDMAAEQIAADPFETVERELATSALVVTPPADLFVPQRANSSGWDLSSSEQLQSLDAARNGFRERRWRWPPAPQHAAAPDTREIINPADPGDVVGSVEEATAQQVEAALQRAVDWSGAEAGVRAETLLRAADLYQEHCGELLALLCREAGKTLPDAIAPSRVATGPAVLPRACSPASRHGTFPWPSSPGKLPRRW